VVHRIVSGGAPNSVRCARLVRGELAALGTRRRHTTIIHRTVRWCTGLSGGAPDCPVSQRLPAQRSAAPSSRDTWSRQWSVGNTILSGVHRTVSGAPTDPKDQRSAVLHMERNRAPDMNSSCPVLHRTVRCTTRQKARMAFRVCLQRLLAALGL
jgi:hypothetical protein